MSFEYIVEKDNKVKKLSDAEAEQCQCIDGKA